MTSRSSCVSLPNAFRGSKCPGCGWNPRADEKFAYVNRVIHFAKKYVNHSSNKGTLCGCKAYAFYFGNLIESRPRVGRPRLGKTHCRSPEGKSRQNKRRNQLKKKLKRVHWTTTVENGVLIKRKHRPGKVDIVTQVTVPAIVAKAIVALSALPAVKPARKPKAPRTPRKRTRSQQIEKLQRLLEQPEIMNNISRWNAINERLEQEYLLQARRDVHENLNKEFIWSDTPEMVYHTRARKRAESPNYKDRFKRYGIVFD